MALQGLPIIRPFHAGPELLSDDDAQVLEWGKGPMEALERFVGGRIAKSLDEELGIEHVFGSAASHWSGSGEVSSIPNMARVPSTSSR